MSYNGFGAVRGMVVPVRIAAPSVQHAPQSIIASSAAICANLTNAIKSKLSSKWTVTCNQIDHNQKLILVTLHGPVSGNYGCLDVGGGNYTYIALPETTAGFGVYPGNYVVRKRVYCGIHLVDKQW